MATEDEEKWNNAVEDEHDRFIKHKVFELVKLINVPRGAKMLASTWAMKKKVKWNF